MKPFITALIIATCATLSANAQSYTDHVQERQQGQGTVTINQSKEIDNLVNGKSSASQRAQAQKTKESTTTGKQVAQPQGTNTAVEKKLPPDRSGMAKKADGDMKTGNTDTPVVDMRKKVMRKSYNITGYRVQAFVGGNSRKDKLKAQQTGSSIKMAFPDQPIYVHFYSPRWICRVGNFRTYEEANSMLHQIQDMGYKSASIVKGKITVQY